MEDLSYHNKFLMIKQKKLKTADEFVFQIFIHIYCISGY